ncbi:hypothetical protein HMPREF1868_01596 [Olsenella sp. DNF00959]|nr:hypothetical protein HMPREF1868_01596 [Olsenella sp. DNF00959]
MTCFRGAFAVVDVPLLSPGAMVTRHIPHAPCRPRRNADFSPNRRTSRRPW